MDVDYEARNVEQTTDDAIPSPDSYQKDDNVESVSFAPLSPSEIQLTRRLEQNTAKAVLRSVLPHEHIMASYHRFLHRYLPRFIASISERDWHTAKYRHVLQLGAITYHLPTHKESNGKIRKIHSSEAKLRGLNYTLTPTIAIYYKQYEACEKSEEYPSGWKLIHHESCDASPGGIPAQVGSAACRNKLTGTSFREDVLDKGGYFIHDGRMKYFVSHLKLRNNYPRVFFNDDRAVKSTTPSAVLIECEYRCDIERFCKVASSLHLYLTVPNKSLYYKYGPHASMESFRSPFHAGDCGLQGSVGASSFSATNDAPAPNRAARSSSLFQFTSSLSIRDIMRQCDDEDQVPADRFYEEAETLTVFLSNLIENANLDISVIFMVLGITSRRQMMQLLCPWVTHCNRRDDIPSQFAITSVVFRLLRRFAMPNPSQYQSQCQTNPSMIQDLKRHVDQNFPLLSSPHDAFNSLMSNQTIHGMTRCDVIAAIVCAMIPKTTVPAYAKAANNVKPLWFYAFERLKKSFTEELLPQAGTTHQWETLVVKQTMIADAVRRMVLVYLKHEAADNLDHLNLKRLHSLGTHFMFRVYRDHITTCLKQLCDVITARCESDKSSDTNKNKDLSIEALVEKYFTPKGNTPLQKLIATGNYSVNDMAEFSGVCEEFDGGTPAEQYERMRRVKIPLPAKSNAIAAHNLHEDKKRFYDDKHTPSSRETGAVLYLCKGVHIRMGYELEELLVSVVKKPAHAIVSIHDAIASLTAVQLEASRGGASSAVPIDAIESARANAVTVKINGTPVGFTVTPNVTIKELRKSRQLEYLPFDVGITWVGGPVMENGPLLCPNDHYINICADVGGHTRPVLVLEHLWKWPHIDRAYWHNHKDRKHMLMEEGVLVYLDVEEISKQTRIATSVETMVAENPLYGAYLLKPDNPDRITALRQLFKGTSVYNPPNDDEYVLDDHILCTESVPNEFRHGVHYPTLYTHCEISGDLATGIIGGMLSFASNTNSARNLFAACMLYDQSATSLPYNHEMNRNHHQLSLVTPTNLLVPNMVDYAYGMGNNIPNQTGQFGVHTLIMAHTHNAEDGTVQTRADTGRGHIVMRHIFQEHIDTGTKKAKDASVFSKPGPDCKNSKTSDYSCIGDDGMPLIGSTIPVGAAVIGVTFRAKQQLDVVGVDGETVVFTQNDRSIINTTHYDQTVTHVIKTVNASGFQSVFVFCETLIVPELGNKGTTDGQKGTIGLLTDPEFAHYIIDFFYNGPRRADGWRHKRGFGERGLTPCVIRNPASYPSRTTMGEFRTVLINEHRTDAQSADCNKTVNDWNCPSIIELGRMLHEARLNADLKDCVFDGKTGRRTTNRMANGYLNYAFLEHVARGKYKARATGPIDIRTRQPSSNVNPGNRNGEMEILNQAVHGVASVMHEHLCTTSDPTFTTVCRRTGMPVNGTTSSVRGQVVCKLCNATDCVVSVPSTYVASMIGSKLMSAAIALRLVVKGEPSLSHSDRFESQLMSRYDDSERAARQMAESFRYDHFMTRGASSSSQLPRHDASSSYTHAPYSPTSPAYSPMNAPSSPVYNPYNSADCDNDREMRCPTSPAYIPPSSPIYDSFAGRTSDYNNGDEDGEMHCPTSPVYIPPYSPTSPAYSPASPTYDYHQSSNDMQPSTTTSAYDDNVLQSLLQ